MSSGTLHGSEWLSIRRSLAILQRLMRGPASKQELIDHVRSVVGPESYQKDPDSAFKRDRVNLKDHFGVEWDYDPSAGAYTLINPGRLFQLDLTDEHLRTLKFLSQTFEDHAGDLARVQSLLDELIQRLPAERRRALERQVMPLDLEFQVLDESETPPHVWKVVSRAVEEHRQLGFHYLSPQHADRETRYHVVAPYRLRFRRGHWYLYGYDLLRRNPLGQEAHDSGHIHFRLRYIQDDPRLEVLPGRLPPEQRRPPRYLAHYLLAPVVGRGDVSQHFEDMTVIRHPDGVAEVRGYSESEWDAVRTLLGYGDNCTVLGGEEVLSLMRQRVRGLAGNYEIG